MMAIDHITLGRRLLEYIDSSTTAMAAELYRQPVHEYTSDNIATQEQLQLFRALPMCVGLSGLLPRPNSFFTHDVSGLPLLLMRNEQGQLRAFLNVCRHRGARVAEGCGKARALVCPYHAWSYDFDGRLKARPADAAFAGARIADHGLRALAVEERNGMIWVMPKLEQALELGRHLGDRKSVV